MDKIVYRALVELEGVLNHNTPVYHTFIKLKKYIRALRRSMDKQINKVKKDEKVATAALKKGLKSTNTLLKLDKVQDKKLKKAGVKPE